MLNAAYLEVVRLWTQFPHDKLKSKVTKFVKSKRFDALIGFVIAFNSVIIGLEQTARINGQSVKVYEALEHCFLVIYVLELVLRFYSFGVQVFRDRAVQFDLCLVIISISTQWVLEPLIGKKKTEDLGPLTVLRTARLARLARSLRLLVQFRQLWMLVRGLLFSAKMVVYTLVVLFVLLYVYAAVGIELIRLDHNYIDGSDTLSEDYRKQVANFFPDVPFTMVTLLQFVCMDSIGAIYRPMIIQYPGLALYFVSIIMIVAVVFMNIVTAVLVNGALEQANQDKEMLRAEQKEKKGKLMKDLRDLFERLDEDGSGMVDREEILNATVDDQYTLNEFMDAKSLLDVFDQLDVDGGGALDIDEFCQGLSEYAISNTPIELKRIDKRIESMRRHQKIMHTEFAKVADRLISLATSLLDKCGELSEPESVKEQKSVEDPSKVGAVSDLSEEKARSPQHVSMDTPGVGVPTWGRELLTELKQLRDSVQELDVYLQSSSSSSLRLSTSVKQPTPVTATQMPKYTSSITSPSIATEEPILAPHVAYGHDGVACIHVSTSDGSNEESQPSRVGTQPLLSLRTLGADDMAVPCELDSADCALHHFPGNCMSASHRGMGGLGYCSTSRSRN